MKLRRKKEKYLKKKVQIQEKEYLAEYHKNKRKALANNLIFKVNED